MQPANAARSGGGREPVSLAKPGGDVVRPANFRLPFPPNVADPNADSRAAAVDVALAGVAAGGDLMAGFLSTLTDWLVLVGFLGIVLWAVLVILGFVYRGLFED